MGTVSTPDGKGFLLETQPGTAQTPEQWCVYVPESTRERRGYDYWYDAKDCELIKATPAPEPTPEDIDTWMREHSTPASRRAYEKRVKAFKRAAATPGKLPADKLIGEHVILGGSELVIAAKMAGGYYAVENHSRGYVGMEHGSTLRNAIRTRDSVRAMDVAA